MIFADFSSLPMMAIPRRRIPPPYPNME